MYRAPLRELRFVIEELLGAAQLASFPGLAEYSDELAASVLEEAARFAQSVLDPLNKPGDTEGARWTPEGVVTAPGFPRRLSTVRRRRLAAARSTAGVRWATRAAGPRYGRTGVLGLRESRLQVMSDVDPGRDPRAGVVGLAGAETTVSAENDQRRVDRHHGSHRAPGGLRSCAGAHARGAGRQALSPLRAEDLHHLGRARHDEPTPFTWCWRASKGHPRA